MERERFNRRQFIGSTAATLVSGATPTSFFVSPAHAEQKKPRHKVERIGVGAVGLRYQGTVITKKAQSHGDIVALCDVDRRVLEKTWKSFGGTPQMELYLMFHAAEKLCRDKGLKIARALVGNYTTSLDMAGCSITLTRLDDEMMHLWDAPVHTAALRWGC